MNKNVKIVIATHKEYQMPKEDIYLPLHVGAKGEDSFGFIRDDSGENISEKNPYFCELTGMYWAWKNLEADYYGLVHYRRHFKGANSSKDAFENVLTTKECMELLDKYDIIVPNKRHYYIESLYSHYEHTHYAEHLDMTRNIVMDRCPEYIKCFDDVMQHRSGYMFNMMIMDKKHYNEYCEWLFDILFTLESQMPKQNLSPFQMRFYGRVSELLFNVWLNYQVSEGYISKDKIKEVPHMNMEKINWLKKGVSFLKAKFFSKKYESSF